MKEAYGGSVRFIFHHPEERVFAEMNEESYTALEMFDGCRSLEEIASFLSEGFDASRESLLNDLLGLHERLRELRLLETE